MCDWFEGLEEAPPTSRGAAVFEEEEIDGTALLGLTENMLKDLGFEKVVSGWRGQCAGYQPMLCGK